MRQVATKASCKKGSKRSLNYKDETLDIYLREIDTYALITREEEYQLAKEIKAGKQEALDKLVRSNLRFVITVAKRYQNRGLALMDLIAEGNLGLIKAAQRFDETKGIRFISYAVWWVRQSILQALADQTRVFRIPINRADAIHKLRKKSNDLRQELGREPTSGELSEGMDMNLDEIGQLQSVVKSPFSLDNPVFFGEDDRKLMECVSDEEDPHPDDIAFENIRTEVIENILGTLKKRETIILTLYFGLGDRDPMTLEEIGSILGITRERVRQIKEKALDRLRHVSRRRKLEAYLN
jgi:RNA polymerase primary sigma factor